MKTLGIDEAGRGPVLGPMVLAGVVVSEQQEKLLKEWGINDSKHFGSHQKAKKLRLQLANQIKQHFLYQIIIIEPTIIDQFVAEKKLNVLERQKAQEIINYLPADRIILDGKNVFKPLCINKTIIAENKADQNYISVSAASILAKNQRDLLFEKFCSNYEKDYGEIGGGGYPNQQTLLFLQWFEKKFKILPDCYRKSYLWKTFIH